ncbi:MAG: hydrolase [Streptosporangiaceae bacterium]|jgi:8-oxo-dGTP pyrophosphatase MutT (NUDIX family)|nr:hydrolase [Streptosporangiaceae bacterium]
MVNGLKLPGEFREMIENVLAGRTHPVVPRHAATVVLLRDHPEAGLQVFMLRRVASMAFAPGAYVFPGGSVDPRDGDQTTAWAGRSPRLWGEAFGAGETLARELVCAAVRETFEESLVLLAGPTEDSVVEDTRDEDWEADRQGLLDRSVSFAEFLDRRGLVLRSDLLRPWSHWITPVQEPKRYDTRFFVAAMPPGQRARDVSTEADRVAWVRPGDALEAARHGEMFLMPPTMITLTELAEYDSVGSVLAADRKIRPLLPELRLVEGEPYLFYPEGSA